jgi:hypothetical protein
VEDHRHGCGGDGLGEGSEIEESGIAHAKIPTSGKIGQKWGTRLRWFIPEISEGFQGYQLSRVCYCDGSCGKCTLLDRFVDNRKGGLELLVLMVEGG